MNMSKEIVTYSNIKVGEKFITVASGKECIKTEKGIYNLTDNRSMLLFPSSLVRRVCD